MNYQDQKAIENKIKSDIEELKNFDNVDVFVDANYQPYVVNGEYQDNSIECAYYYNMLKEIESDERFFNKLYFVLDSYIKCKK